MSDYYPAEIHVGGPIPARLVDKLIHKMVAAQASLNGYGEPAAPREDLRVAFHKGGLLCLYDDRARNGMFEELEQFLVKHRLHFDRHSDAYGEYNAEKVCYRGGAKPLVLQADQCGNIVSSWDELAAILDRKEVSDQEKVVRLQRLLRPPETAALQPIHLVQENDHG